MKEYSVDLKTQGKPLFISPNFMRGPQEYSALTYESGIDKFDTFLEGRRLAETILDFKILAYDDFFAFAITDDNTAILTYCVKKEDLLNIIPYYKQVFDISTKGSLSNKLGILSAVGGIAGGIAAITIHSLANRKHGFFTKTKKIKGCIHEMLIKDGDSEPSKIRMGTEEGGTVAIHQFFKSAFKIDLLKTNPNYGCYIATVCYGTENAREVNKFRQFRDEVLANRILGRLFIKLYYSTAPTISIWLKRHKNLSQFVRKFILDRVYKVL